ncbi:hypothetical protein IAU60_005052 [Kwoniella sp. DSM 27419]
MSRQPTDAYDDPYNSNVYHGYEPPAMHDRQHSDATYGVDPSYSTEKLPHEYEGTERAQPGRSGLRQAPVSVAEMGPPPRSTGILRMWRKDERGKQWSRGGGVRMSLRLCCCCFTIGIILIISVLLSIVLYVRPPSFALNSVNIGSSPVGLTSDGLTVNFDLSISVANPNWFNADFKEITANARYPGNNTNSFGGGTLYNVDFKGYTASTFDFPFTLNPTISNSASFECPITEKDIESIVGSGSLSDIIGS